jgi:hypothetical protein
MNPYANLQGDRVAARASQPQGAPPRHFLRERDLFASTQSRIDLAKAWKPEISWVRRRSGCRLAHPGYAHASLPGLARQSISLRKKLLAKEMDARIISASTRVFDALLPAHDVLGQAPYN